MNGRGLEEETPRDNPGVFISEHYRKGFGYTTFRSNGTDDWLIAFTLSGEGVFEDGGDMFRCASGDLALVPPRLRHHYYTPQGAEWEFVWAHFKPKPYWSHLLRLPVRLNGLMTVRIETPAIHERIRGTFERIIGDSLDMETNWEELCLSALEEILLLVHRQLAVDEKGLQDPRVQSVLERLTADIRRRHSIRELAASVNLSPSRLTHLFKEQTGESVVEALNHIRLRLAARYLRGNDESVGHIAREVGIPDPFYFAKRFKARYGVSPSEYRASFRRF
ncbi:helix-turn-helix domain-containing protein [Cohnella silvisoli]|uniref:Helix-turn-helix domain-containing protein n=1 Tax=Cohnella silvisoli TaxID=2873699 RepID=A0ABV1L450_9BACL|nr:helix-turn-helix domain-containing protein [Cohnella silvisoli]MCD9026417.1 helix-turn-helix domain-containing protein [Cohnella silvisoli]